MPTVYIDANGRAVAWNYDGSPQSDPPPPANSTPVVVSEELFAPLRTIAGGAVVYYRGGQFVTASDIAKTYDALIERRARALEKSSDPADQIAALKLRLNLAGG